MVDNFVMCTEYGTYIQTFLFSTPTMSIYKENPMKALIIDDEPHVITVAELLVEWEKYGIDTVLGCGSSEEALAIIDREQPEIILSDINLPGLSGLDLIERLRETNMSTQVVLITAYGDFAYAQRAVQLGCVDYLLKPLDDKPLNRAVEKAVRIYKENSRMASSSNLQKIQNLMTMLTASGGTNLPIDVQNGLAALVPAFRGMTSCRAAVICLRHLMSDMNVRQSMAAQIQHLLDERSAGAVTLTGESGDLLLLLRGESADRQPSSAEAAPMASHQEESASSTSSLNADFQARSRLLQICREVLQLLKEHYHLSLQMGLSEEAAYPQDLGLALRQARDYATSANMLLTEPMIHAQADTSSFLPNYEWIERELGSTLFSNHPERVRELLSRLADNLLEDGMVSVRETENFRTLYNSTRTKCVLAIQREYGIPTAAPQTFDASFFPEDGIFRREHFIDILYHDLMALERQYTDHSTIVTIGELCRRIHRYMEVHFAEDISLELLADRYGISPAYLSRSYKKEIGCGLVDDLTRIRLEEARRLMAGPMRTADIASAVGIPDPKYFIRVFKKIYRMTPGEFRETLKGGKAIE